MDVRTVIFHVVCIFSYTNFVTTLDVQNVPQTVTQPSFTSGSSQLDALVAQTSALEAKLNREILKREALEKEVQSKNDLTEFLKQDVEAMTRTLVQEKARGDQLEVNLAQVESVVKNLQATLAEDRGLVPKLTRDLKALDTRLSNQISALNGSLQTVLATSNRNTEALQNLTVQFSNTNALILNQTMGMVDSSVRHLNESMHQELSAISTSVSSLYAISTSNGNRIDTLNNSLSKQKVELRELNVTMNSNQNTLGGAIIQLTISINDYVTHFNGLKAAMTVSVDKIKADLASFQSTESTEVVQLTRDVANVKARVDEYVIIAGEFNKTLNALSSAGQQSGQAGSDSVSYFFAYKPAQHGSGVNFGNSPEFNGLLGSSDFPFSTYTSLFTCSIPGLYLFSVTIQKDEMESNPRIQCSLKLNGAMVVTIDAHSAFIGSSPSASSTVVVNLSKGDVMELGQCTRNTRMAEATTSFAGVLLQRT